ncbi:MAG: hypothetical protein V7L25_15065 [Nostoc sp.]|uniref:hypothetical protein n=1 Tax=Nostoc sp. TaxID=1180 RepID=UPI002FF06E7F
MDKCDENIKTVAGVPTKPTIAQNVDVAVISTVGISPTNSPTNFSEPEIVLDVPSHQPKNTNSLIEPPVVNTIEVSVAVTTVVDEPPTSLQIGSCVAWGTYIKPRCYVMALLRSNWATITG